ncbi:TA system VapC family ribonuclease toxin [Pedococcus sp. P5_B7]
MIIFDVNVFVNAMDLDAASYPVANEALVRALTGTEPVGIIDETLTATVRICTNRRIKAHTASTDRALAFCERIRSAPMAERIRSGPDAWQRFTTMVTALELRGNDITDAWFAAQAIGLDAHFVTFDRGFQRFPGLRLTVLG